MDVRESAKVRPLDFDVDCARAHFPALKESWAFFDNAGGSQILQPVIDRIAAYLTSSNVQLGASFAVSELAGRRLRQATDAVATLLNARDRAEVVMGGSTTMLLRILADSFGRWPRAGDENVRSTFASWTSISTR